MKPTYPELRNMAREIVATLPRPKFYSLFKDEITISKELLSTNPMLVKLKNQISSLLQDDFGHGMLHSELVSIDAGAIVQIEMGKLAEKFSMERGIFLAQTAGLLHDIKRKEKYHSKQGAIFAKQLLGKGKYDLTLEEIETVCNAIHNHEAFQDKETIALPFPLISDALYDADKFRWGPDNFTHTVWDMVIFANIPLADFLLRFPGGMKKLSQIRNTFRTKTGKAYGPGFIDLGLEAGELLLTKIQKQHSELFSW